MSSFGRSNLLVTRTIDRNKAATESSDVEVWEQIMRTMAMEIAIFLIAVSAFAQQSTTNTDCNINGQQVNCTSTTTTPTPPTGGAVAGFNKAMAANRERADANRASRSQQAQQAKADAGLRQAQENRAVVNIIYCRQNATGSVTTGDGQVKSCIDELAYARAECMVNTAMDLCKLFLSHAEIEKAFADLAEEYENDHPNRRSSQMYYDSLFQAERKWACLSYPDTKWPLRDGTYQPCPNAPVEPPNAVSQTKQ
jgi:hypothetical protein